MFILEWMSYLRYLSVLILSIYVSFIQSRVYADGQPVLNEFLVHPSTGDKEWVELYVPDGVDVTNYWIDDDIDFASDTGSSGKKQITSVVQGSDGRHIVYELTSSMFNNNGDTVALFSPDGTLIDQYHYTDDPGSDISIGRTPDATGDFQVLISATRGSPNSYPKPSETPTPVPTDKPTPTPKPAATQKPAKNPTLANNSVTKASALSDTAIGSDLKKNLVPTVKTGSNSAYPTSILGASTKSAERKITRTPTKPVLVKGITSTMPQIIAVSIGGLLLAGCGILLYLKRIRKHE